MPYLRARLESMEGTGELVAGQGPLRFLASTEGIKRDGQELKVEDWYLDNYRRNPVVLWAHDYFGRQLPIGRAEATIDFQRRALVADVTFDPGDPFAREVERKYREGYLHTVSVGWDTIEIERRRMLDLLDISAVPVPGDPDALMERTIRALREAGYDIKPQPVEATETVGQAESGEEETAALNAAEEGAEARLKAVMEILEERANAKKLEQIFQKVNGGLR